MAIGLAERGRTEEYGRLVRTSSSPTVIASGNLAKSIVAVPAYVAALPVALVLGHSRFMLVLVKLFDHLGKLLALMRINPVKEPYVTE